MREHPMVVSVLARKLVADVGDTIGRKLSLLDDREDRLQLAQAACEAALAVAAVQHAAIHRDGFANAVTAAFNGLRERMVLAIAQEIAERALRGTSSKPVIIDDPLRGAERGRT